MPTRTIVLSDDDLASAKRLLSNLTESAPEAVSGDRPEPGSQDFRKLARAALVFRQRRAEHLHRAMLGEPAYDMLLSLYIAEGDGDRVTLGHLAEIAGVASSSASRWIEYLIAKQLVVREAHPSNKRASSLKLSAKGKTALENVFQHLLAGYNEVAL